MWYLPLGMLADARPSQVRLSDAARFRILAEGTRHFGQPTEVVIFSGQKINGFQVSFPTYTISPVTMEKADLGFFPGEQFADSPGGILLLARKKYSFQLPQDKNGGEVTIKRTTTTNALGMTATEQLIPIGRRVTDVVPLEYLFDPQDQRGTVIYPVSEATTHTYLATMGYYMGRLFANTSS